MNIRQILIALLCGLQFVGLSDEVPNVYLYQTNYYGDVYNTVTNIYMDADLSDYYNKADVDSRIDQVDLKFNNYILATDVTNLIDSISVTNTTVDNYGTIDISGDYTKTITINDYRSVTTNIVHETIEYDYSTNIVYSYDYTTNYYPNTLIITNVFNEGSSYVYNDNFVPEEYKNKINEIINQVNNLITNGTPEIIIPIKDEEEDLDEN